MARPAFGRALLCDLFEGPPIAIESSLLTAQALPALHHNIDVLRL